MTDLTELKRLHAEATAGEWVAGRRDMISYHGDGCGPYNNVYAPNPKGKMHLGTRIDDVVCEACDAVGVDCRDNAEWIAAIHNSFPQLAATIETQTAEIADLRRQLIEARAELNTARATK